MAGQVRRRGAQRSPIDRTHEGSGASGGAQGDVEFFTGASSQLSALRLYVPSADRSAGSGAAVGLHPPCPVVIPTHDRRAMLLRTLRSVLAQRWIELEVLVIDDGSTDDTQAAVRSLHDPRFACSATRRLEGWRRLGTRVRQRPRGPGSPCSTTTTCGLPTSSSLQVTAAQEAGARWAYAGAVEIDEDGASPRR